MERTSHVSDRRPPTNMGLKWPFKNFDVNVQNRSGIPQVNVLFPYFRETIVRKTTT